MMKRGRSAQCVIAVVLAMWAAVAGADIALLKTNAAVAANNKLWMYNDDGTAKNIFGGGTTNLLVNPGTEAIQWTDVALLSNGDIAISARNGAAIILLDGGTGAVKATAPELAASNPGEYPYKIAGMPNGAFCAGGFGTGRSLHFYSAPTWDGSDWVLAAPTVVDITATTGSKTSFSNAIHDQADLTLAPGQLKAADPQVAVMAYSTANSPEVQFYNVNGLQAAKTIPFAGVRASYQYGVAADASEADGGPVHQSKGPWPTAFDFDKLTTAAEILYSDGVTDTSRTWSDLAVLSPGTLLSIESQGDSGVYTVTLTDPVAPATVGTATTTVLFALPETVGWNDCRVDASIIVPEPVTMVLLGLGAGALLRRRRRRA